MSDPTIPSWEFETNGRSALFSALFPREDFDPTFESTYQDVDRAFGQLVSRLTDYDADTFRSELVHADA